MLSFLSPLFFNTPSLPHHHEICPVLAPLNPSDLASRPPLRSLYPPNLLFVRFNTPSVISPPYPFTNLTLPFFAPSLPSIALFARSFSPSCQSSCTSCPPAREPPETNAHRTETADPLAVLARSWHLHTRTHTLQERPQMCN